VVYACKLPAAVAKQGRTFEVSLSTGADSEIKEMVLRSYVARYCLGGRDAYARKAKRPAAAAPTRPSLTEREPAALSLSCSSPESEEPPLPVDLAPEEDVVMEPEPEAAGPEAGMVPLFWGKGAATAAVVVGAGAVAISASDARAEDSTAAEVSEMALSTAVWTAWETDEVAASAPAAALSVAPVTAAEETTEETAEATSGFSATTDVTAAEASAAAGARWLLALKI
jgi:hypothetical protein